MNQGQLSDIILASMTDGVITLDGSGLISAMNPAAAAALGLDSDQVVGMPFGAVFFAFEENDAFNQILLDLVGSGEEKAYAEVPFRREDGSTLQLAVTSSLLDRRHRKNGPPREGEDRRSQEQHLGAVIVFKDITAVARLRAERDELSQELAAKHKELQDAYVDLEEKATNLSVTQRYASWIKLGLGVLAGLFVLGVMVWVVFSESDHSGLSGGSGAAPAVQDVEDAEQAGPLKRLTANKGDVLVAVSASGFLEPMDVFTVAAGVGGRVVERYVDIGDHVEKGQPLMLLDPAEVLPKVRQAEAAQLKAKEAYREVFSWSSRPEFQQARRALEMAKVNLEQEKKKFEETQKLFDRGIIPRQELDSARTSLMRAQFDLAAAEERLSTAGERGGVDKVKVAKLELDNADAALREAQGKLKATRILAPTDGVVMRPPSQGGDGKKGGGENRLPEIGSQVNQGQPLLSVGADQPLGVVVRVNEMDVRQIKQGQRARITGVALGDKPLKGTVRAVAPQAVLEQNTPIFPVMVEIAPLDDKQVHSLRLGMSASVQIVVQEVEGATLVPVVAVKHHQGKPAVKVEEEGKLVWKPIEIGISDRQFVEVKSGLKPGDTVVY